MTRNQRPVALITFASKRPRLSIGAAFGGSAAAGRDVPLRAASSNGTFIGFWR